MPIPKTSDPSAIQLDSTLATRMVKVVKPYKVDMPDIRNNLVELAEKARQAPEDPSGGAS